MTKHPLIPSAALPSRRLGLGLVRLALGCSLLVSCRTTPAPVVEIAFEACGEASPQSELLCGRLAVPENPARPDGRQIELFVMVAPAVEPSGVLPPMYVLEGGPGVAASNFGEFAVTDGALYRQGRDVVMVDLRGAGRSHPLHCLELDHRTPQSALGEMYPLAEVEACHDELQQGADLTQYTTAHAVSDLEAVREALGHEQIDLQALSYGTRLAFEYVRRHPERVRRVAVIGTLAPSHRMPLQHAAGFERAFDLLLEDCAADPACSTAYPTLREDWLGLLAALEEEPARFVYSPGDAAAPIELSIGREVLAEELRSAMYFSSVARSFPLIVDAAARGDWGPFLELALPEPSDGPPPLAEGVYLSITCTEDLARIAPEEIAPHTAGSYLGDYRVAQQEQACAVWPTGSLPADFGTPVVSSVPTLLITGDRDPVTPPSDAEEVAASLENARLLIVPHAGHLPFDVSDPECVDRMIVDFLSRPDPLAVDDSCTKGLEPAPFAVP